MLVAFKRWLHFSLLIDTAVLVGAKLSRRPPPFTDGSSVVAFIYQVFTCVIFSLLGFFFLVLEIFCVFYQGTGPLVLTPESWRRRIFVCLIERCVPCWVRCIRCWVSEFVLGSSLYRPASLSGRLFLVIFLFRWLFLWRFLAGLFLMIFSPGALSYKSFLRGSFLWDFLERGLSCGIFL